MGSASAVVFKAVPVIVKEINIGGAFTMRSCTINWQKGYKQWFNILEAINLNIILIEFIGTLLNFTIFFINKVNLKSCCSCFT